MRRLVTSTLTTVLVLGVLALPTAAHAQGSGSITGQVTQSGGAVANACISAYLADDSLTTRGTAATDGSGNFTVSGLTAGADYKLYVYDCEDPARFATEWFDGAVDFTDARAVTASTSPTAIAVTVEPDATISGTVTGDLGAALPDICVKAILADHPTLSADASTASDGSYTIDGLPGGSYLVRFRDCDSARSGGTYAQEFYDDARGPASADPVGVSNAGNAGPVNAQLVRGGTIQGTATRSGGSGSQICVEVVDLAAPGAVHQDLTDSTGSYSVNGLLPGSYRVGFFDCADAPTHAFEYWNGADGTANPAAATAVTLGTAGSAATANATLAQGGAIAGTISGTPGTPAAGACVEAFVEGFTDYPVAGTTSASNGAYTLRGLAGGVRYRIEAYDCSLDVRRYGLHHYDDEVVLGNGDLVGVTAGQTAGNVHVVLGERVYRIWGDNRVLTAVRTSQNGYDRASTVVLARSDTYPDALAGGPLARQLNAPILLTPPNFLDAATRDEIDRLDASTVILLGGTVALSANVEQQVEAIPGVTADRIAGNDRFDTARKIAARVGGRSVYVVEGADPLPTRGWPDAVAVSALASYQGWPILLVTTETLPQATIDAFEANDVQLAQVVGGPVAVSGDVVDAIETYVGNVPDRIFGQTRYGTSVAVARRSVEVGLEPQRVWGATGEDFPDALTAGPTVARDNGVLLLVGRGGLQPEPAAYLSEARVLVHRLIVLGGPVAVADATVSQIRQALTL